jgi:chromate transporter
VAQPTLTLGQLAAVFLRLGVVSFGGPAAHLAMMEEEFVRRRGVLTHEEFLDLMGAANLIPGPNSTEVAIHIGHRLAGWPGLLIAGLCFILPAALIVAALASVYVAFGSLPAALGILAGVKPVVIAVVVQALLKLGRSCLKSWPLAVLGVGIVVLSALGVDELVLLFGSGLLVALWRGVWTIHRSTLPVIGVSLASAGSVGVTGSSIGLLPLFLVFLKVGSVLFGSGYVLLAFLRADLVERNHWLTEQQLLDAVAVGQVTPGPVFTTATFIGYVLAGPAGAVVATVGIFLPAFVFVAISVPLLPRLRRSAVTAAFLDGVNVASVALMAVVTWQLGRAAIVDVTTAVLAMVSAVLLMRWRVNSAWLVLGGAVVGLVRTAICAVTIR